MVKVIWQKATLPLHMDGAVVFNRWRQCAPPPNTRFLGSTRVPIPNSISIGSAVYAQLMAERPNTLQWAALSPPSKLPLPMGNQDPHIMHGSLGSPKSSTQMASHLVQLLLQGSLLWQTDREHTTLSVTIGHPHLATAAMWSNHAYAR